MTGKLPKEPWKRKPPRRQKWQRGYPPPAVVIRWLGKLKVTQGPLIGQPVVVLPFQRRFIRGFLGSQEAALTVARGNGKTTICAGLALCSFLGPMAVPAGETVIVASSLGQARTAFKHCLAFFHQLVSANDIGKADKYRYRVIDNSHHREIHDRQTNNTLRLLGSDPDRAHSLAPSLILADEPAKWKRREGDLMHAALVTSLGKQDPSRFLAIGTQSDDESHWFNRMLDAPDDGVYAQRHAAAETLGDFNHRAIVQANPAYKHLVPLQRELARAKQNARKGGGQLVRWRALRLNRGTPEAGRTEFVVQVADWKACEVAQLPAREGPLCVGLDAGGSTSMTAIAFYWPQTGRLEASAAFPAVPDLIKRGESDGVGEDYLRMQERGELKIYPGRVTPVGQFIEDHAALVSGSEVLGIVTDRYKKSDVEQALAEAGVAWDIEWRGVGAGRDGSADVRAFQKEVLEAEIRVSESLLIRAAIRNGRVSRDPNGNPRIEKGRERGRIDALQAMVHAVGAGRRWRYPAPGDGNSISEYYRSGGKLEVAVG